MIAVSARKRGGAYMSADVRVESSSNTCYYFSGDALERFNRASSAHSSTPLVFVLRAYSDVHKGTRLDAPGETLGVGCAGRAVLVVSVVSHGVPSLIVTRSALTYLIGSLRSRAQDSFTSQGTRAG